METYSMFYVRKHKRKGLIFYPNALNLLIIKCKLSPPFMTASVTFIFIIFFDFPAAQVIKWPTNGIVLAPSRRFVEFYCLAVHTYENQFIWKQQSGVNNNESHIKKRIYHPKSGPSGFFAFFDLFLFIFWYFEFLLYFFLFFCQSSATRFGRWINGNCKWKQFKLNMVGAMCLKIATEAETSMDQCRSAVKCEKQKSTEREKKESASVLQANITNAITRTPSLGPPPPPLLPPTVHVWLGAGQPLAAGENVFFVLTKQKQLPDGQARLNSALLPPHSRNSQTIPMGLLDIVGSSMDTHMHRRKLEGRITIT